MSDNPFKGIELPKLKFELPDFSGHMRQMDAISKETERVMAEKWAKEERYKEDTLSTLKSIEKNTGDISQLVSLLNDNADKQTEILEVMTDIMAIGTSRSTEEAESKYRGIMNKINQVFDDAETMEKLLGLSKVFYHSSVAYIKHKLTSGE